MAYCGGAYVQADTISRYREDNRKTAEQSGESLLSQRKHLLK